ncbi:MAG: hypothetical protein P8J32_06480 [bacterium]|nr:hypothetical protein [bacterium]
MHVGHRGDGTPPRDVGQTSGGASLRLLRRATATVPPWDTAAPGMEGLVRFLEGILNTEPLGSAPTITQTGEWELTISRWEKTPS